MTMAQHCNHKLTQEEYACNVFVLISVENIGTHIYCSIIVKTQIFVSLPHIFQECHTQGRRRPGFLQQARKYANLFTLRTLYITTRR